MKISEVLRLAKPLLAANSKEWEVKEFLICNAIHSVESKGKITAEDRHKSINFINIKLGRHLFYTTLAEEQGLLPKYAIGCDVDSVWRDQAQQLRHQWLDQLIKELEDAGN